ncbi:glycosyltransferase [Bradyrhizobium sp. AUGA SZCCT0274]|uniref:glycosyltransferase n=1 Tax=Bradyrhizobium sp. AUGA SZCCT0274 TaxID=2807670 RepID=UPI001BA51152|nr:glycosyltransferase [Bradyrhizobium sp. AUGA SZCCT0274]MBR1244190.1 glycosyltransferase [Bradyrhizobium sp. AUGA SZCCT0274]
MPADRRPIVVSLTPLPLSADSRTLKQVTSVHRFGFKSIVIEGRPSHFATEALSFEVITVHPPENTGGASALVMNDIGGGSDKPVFHETRSVPQLSQQFPIVRSIVRLVPGSRKLVRGLAFRLERAIAARRMVGDNSDRISVSETIGALPRATRIVIADFAKYLLSFVALHPLAFIRHWRAFVRHWRTYLREHVFRVFSVTPRADLYYLHAFYQFPAVWILSRWYGAKLIYDAHDFYLHQLDDPGVSSYWKKWVIPFERIIERVCVWSADEVVTVNDGIASLMRKQFGCEALITRNVHDFRLDHQPARSIRETIGLSPSEFLVVSIGNYKSGIILEPVLDALQSLPGHVHLAFLGGGYPALDDAAALRGLTGRVHLMGRVLPQEVVPFARSADAAILLYFGRTPNYPNALPNGLFQSIAAELPLVYPNLEQIRRLAERYGVGIMADPQKPAEIEAALRSLLEDGELRTVLRNNLRVAERELCWEREEQVLKKLLCSHLNMETATTSVVEDKMAG